MAEDTKTVRNTHKPGAGTGDAPAPVPPEDRKEFACSACADTGQVVLPLTGVSGPILTDVACPKCEAGNLRLESATTPQIRDLDTRVTILAGSVILLALAIVMIGYAVHSGNLLQPVVADLKESLHD